jgi:hypothetical protein
VPDSDPSRRNTPGGSALAQAGKEGATAALGLAVLSSLPARHQTYLFDRVREKCRIWLRRNGIPTGDMTSHELASEVWLKLLASVSTDADDTSEPLEPDPDEWSVDSANPERDGRVTWLIGEIGGSQAIGHRYSDLQRERYGRTRRLQQPGDDDEPEEPGSGGPDDQTDRQKAEDVLRVWRGLLVTARGEFRPDDDVSLLLRLLAEMPDLLEDSSGMQWPIGKLVGLLSKRPPPRAWSEDKVDNAKRRLTNWIGRLMRKNGFDTVDLEGLFAAVARRDESVGEPRRPGEHRSRPLN